MLAAALDPETCAKLVASVRWRVVVTDEGCWQFQHKPRRDGYCVINVGTRDALAHRVALVAFLGRDVSPEMHVGHVCHDDAVSVGSCVSTRESPCAHRSCVNPAHLREQSPRENSLSGGTRPAEQARRTRCPRGHELSGDNLIPSQLAHGGRQCLTCNRDNARAGAAERDATIRRAARSLGVSWSEYVQKHGKSAVIAKSVLESHTDKGE